VNKRAKTRLIGVTAIILLAVVALLASGVFGGNTAYYRTVPEIASDSELVGERIKVGGTVVAGSWDQKQNPMTFVIRDEADSQEVGPELTVVYSGAVPATFGDGVTAIITGELAEDGTISATEMITKCPSKYESAEGAMSIADLLDRGDEMFNKTVKATGYVKSGTIVAPGSGQRFVVTNDADGGAEVPVAWEGALPEGMVDGSKIVLTGSMEEDGFVATSVAMEQR
jgi:cytochrome c-type biogenesis protein CcmE